MKTKCLQDGNWALERNSASVLLLNCSEWIPKVPLGKSEGSIQAILSVDHFVQFGFKLRSRVDIKMLSRQYRESHFEEKTTMGVPILVRRHLYDELMTQPQVMSAADNTVTYLIPVFNQRTKIEGCHQANFAAGCHHDNRRCRQWWQSWHYNNSQLAVTDCSRTQHKHINAVLTTYALYPPTEAVGHWEGSVKRGALALAVIIVSFHMELQESTITSMG